MGHARFRSLTLASSATPLPFAGPGSTSITSALTRCCLREFPPGDFVKVTGAVPGRPAVRARSRAGCAVRAGAGAAMNFNMTARRNER
eukprot:scaffold385290_cov27-Prasinocladus_malaysianus.AAC.2